MVLASARRNSLDPTALIVRKTFILKVIVVLGALMKSHAMAMALVTPSLASASASLHGDGVFMVSVQDALRTTFLDPTTVLPVHLKILAIVMILLMMILLTSLETTAISPTKISPTKAGG